MKCTYVLATLLWMVQKWEATASPVTEPVRSSRPKKPSKRYARNEWIHIGRRLHVSVTFKENIEAREGTNVRIKFCYSPKTKPLRLSCLFLVLYYSFPILLPNYSADIKWYQIRSIPAAFRSCQPLTPIRQKIGLV